MTIRIESSNQRDGTSDFDFQRGEWQVRHRVTRSSQDAWIEFGGTCRNRRLIDGSANVEEHTFVQSAGVTHGIALRAYDSKAGTWAIWWVDSRNPTTLDPPVAGGFENGVGTFIGPDVNRGQPVLCRYRWYDITANTATWDQALSPDNGATWETNWVMHFTRAT